MCPPIPIQPRKQEKGETGKIWQEIARGPTGRLETIKVVDFGLKVTTRKKLPGRKLSEQSKVTVNVTTEKFVDTMTGSIQTKEIVTGRKTQTLAEIKTGRNLDTMLMTGRKFDKMFMTGSPTSGNAPTGNQLLGSKETDQFSKLGDRKCIQQETDDLGLEFDRKISGIELGNVPGNRSCSVAGKERKMSNSDRKWPHGKPSTPGISPFGKIGKYTPGKGNRKKIGKGKILELKRKLFEQSYSPCNYLNKSTPLVIQDLERSFCATQSDQRKVTHPESDFARSRRLVEPGNTPKIATNQERWVFGHIVNK